MTTTARLLNLLSLLQVPREWPGPVLAERLGVSSRTVRRDVDRLRELGYAISSEKGPNGGYQLAAGSDLPPLLFDDEQAMAFAVALQSVPSAGIDLDEAASRALATVRQVMPSRLRHRLDSVVFAATGRAARVDSQVLEAVSASVRDQRILRFEYGDEAFARRVEPHAVVARGGRWYLVAWEAEKANWRTFRIDRIRPRIPAGAPFERRPIPTGDACTFLAARSKGSEGADVWPCYGEVVLQLGPADIAPWLGDGEMEQVSDSECRVRVGSWSWAGLISWILRFDAPFTAVGPEELVDALPRFAERIAGATS